MSEDRSELAPEDAKLVTLARSTRARTQSSQGAAVRDLDGRTYAGASVALSSLRLSALEVCVAMAISSGARGLEAAVVLAQDPSEDPDLAAAADFAGTGIAVHVGDVRGAISRTLTTQPGDRRDLGAR